MKYSTGRMLCVVVKIHRKKKNQTTYFEIVASYVALGFFFFLIDAYVAGSVAGKTFVHITLTNF